MRNQLQKANFIYAAAILLLTTSIAFSQGTTPVNKIPPKPKFSDFMGINFNNVIVHDPTLYAQTCRLARDYHPVTWDVWDSYNGSTNFPGNPWSKNGVNWDPLYGNWLNAGYRVMASLMDLERYVNHVPNNCFSADVVNELQAYGTRFARSFGPGGKWPRVETAQIENEPYQSSNSQYQSLFNALATGIRQGDAQLKIVTCAATADFPSRSEYDKSIQILDTNLFDIISMHTYALKSSWPAWEFSYPEDPGLDYLNKLDRMISYKQSNASMANKPIWITEFGFDAGSLEAQARHPLWRSSTLTEQAQWIVRSFLVFSEKDVERAYLSIFQDDDYGNLHGASGIVRRDPVLNTHTPKPSFYAMRHLFNALGSYRFKRVVNKQQGGIYTFEYEHTDDANQLVWVIWSATKGKADSSVTLTNFPTNQQVRIETLSLADGQVTSTTTSASGNNLNIIVSETPKFLFFTAPTNFPPVAGASLYKYYSPTSALLVAWGSHDPEGGPITYYWEKTAGPEGSTLLYWNSASPVVNGLVNGTYTFRLTVTDNQGATGSKELTFTVNNNLPPIAGAWLQKYNSPTSVLLAAWGSHDPEGGPITYYWQKTAGPEGSTLLYGNSASPVVDGLVNGTYTLTLTVTDNQGATGSKELTFTVSGAALSNIRPQSLLPADENVNTNKAGQLIVYPTSVKDILNFRWRNEYTGDAMVTVMNMSGQKVKDIRIRKTVGQYNGRVELTGLKPGQYYLHIRNERQTWTEGFLKE